MLIFKRQFFSILFVLFAGLFAVGSVSAQTWSQDTGANPGNPCVNQNQPDPADASTMVSGDIGQCSCPQSYTFGKANNANCTMDGFLPGCWNPTNGTCNTCGQGGTVQLGMNGCFNNGQSNSGGTNAGGSVPIGISCVSTGGANSTQCLSSGTATGGFSTN